MEHSVMVTEQGIKTINLYDIFANIIPGLAFLLGLLVPIKVIPVLHLIFGVQTTFEFGLGHLLLIIAIAFILGQLLQAFGSQYDGDHGFSDIISKIRGEAGDDVELSEFHQPFWHYCKKEFQLTEEFEGYNRLFKAVLAYLESSPRNRALRMQALYLFTRGVFVATVFLALIYSVTSISLEYGYIPADLMVYFRSQRALSFGIIITFVIAYVTGRERLEFEQDWIEYTIIEFYLEVCGKHEKPSNIEQQQNE